MASSSLNKDKCDVSKGLIMTQSKIMICSECINVVHGKCAKSLFEYNHLKSLWMFIVVTVS